jgi:hypothetical protein
MADNQNVTTVVSHPNWGAIWSGVFTFLGIWTVFGLLGTAIFPSAAGPTAAQPIAGMGLGISIWSVILTIVALFVAGRVTGHLAGIGNARDGVVHGMIMFGLAMPSTLVIVSLAGMAMGASVTGAHGVYVLSLFGTLGWAGFVGTFLGWLAALGGASMGAREIVRTAIPQQQEARRAAWSSTRSRMIYSTKSRFRKLVHIAKSATSQRPESFHRSAGDFPGRPQSHISGGCVLFISSEFDPQ